MNKAVFLDRDGVINSGKNHYYVHTRKNFIINQGVVPFIKLCNQKGYVVIVISNQSGIAKGLYNIADVDALHNYFQQILLKEGTRVSEFYYCPHHPDYTRCLCRKPQPLLIQKALVRFSVDPSQSILFGDQQRDVDAAMAAGVKGIKIEPDENLMNYKQLIEK